ncbi:unnamed protein product [Cladocopium goreaui]|uniref:Uncharacterized protein n=1 Tax=Cladocopium goreaui TaxID=2562237 RepID=A0A9P1CY20_9DINO|nr:unnamed protein product [Cladocopium goreaui]
MVRMTECTVALEGIGTIEGLGVVDREWMSVVWRVVLEGIGNLPTMVSYNKGRAIVESPEAELVAVHFVGQGDYERALAIWIDQSRPSLFQGESLIPT